MLDAVVKAVEVVMEVVVWFALVTSSSGQKPDAKTPSAVCSCIMLYFIFFSLACFEAQHHKTAFDTGYIRIYQDISGYRVRVFYVFLNMLISRRNFVESLP